MTQLNTAQQALATFLDANVDAAPIAPVIPAAPAAWAGYVWPNGDWISVEDDDTYCVRYSVGMVFDLVASIASLTQAQEWINDRVEEALLSCADGVEVLPGELISPTGTSGSPFIVSTDQGSELLVARIEFTRFTLEGS